MPGRPHCFGRTALTSQPVYVFSRIRTNVAPIGFPVYTPTAARLVKRSPNNVRRVLTRVAGAAVCAAIRALASRDWGTIASSRTVEPFRRAHTTEQCGAVLRFVLKRLALCHGGVGCGVRMPRASMDVGLSKCPADLPREIRSAAIIPPCDPDRVARPPRSVASPCAGTGAPAACPAAPRRAAPPAPRGSPAASSRGRRRC